MSLGINYKLKRLSRKKSIYFFYSLYIIVLAALYNYSEISRLEYFEYLNYVLYGASIILGLYPNWRLLKRYEYKTTSSDLQVWSLNIISIVMVIVGGILLSAGMMFFGVQPSYIQTGTAVGNYLALFTSSLGAGLLLVSSYLYYKFRQRSGVTVYRY